jgi:hypothetical protein
MGKPDTLVSRTWVARRYKATRPIGLDLGLVEGLLVRPMPPVYHVDVTTIDVELMLVGREASHARFSALSWSRVQRQ